MISLPPETAALTEDEQAEWNALKEGDIPAFQRSLDLDLEIPAGMYYFTLTHPQGAATQRFIIQR